jgi:hypothetical protein
MRLLGPGRLGPAVVILGAASSAVLLFAVSPLSRSSVQAGCSASSPCPTPVPANAFLSLSVTSGDPNTQITVNGGAFFANEQMTLYWDTPDHVAGGANADKSGNFVTTVKPFAGDNPGGHKLCASVPPNPCANFTLVAAAPSPSASPSAEPTPSESPSPAASATAGTSPTPISGTLNGFDVISSPPFVFLPIIGGLAILFSLGYWVLSIVRRPAPLKIPATAVVHRASRPDYAAGFGTPPPPAQAPPPPSAWDALPAPPQPASPAPEPPPALPGPPVTEARSESLPEPPPVDWDVPPPASSAGPDDPLDLPEPGD